MNKEYESGYDEGYKRGHDDGIFYGMAMLAGFGVLSAAVVAAANFFLGGV